MHQAEHTLPAPTRRPATATTVAVLSGLVLLVTAIYLLRGDAALDHSITRLINQAAGHSAWLDHVFLALTQGNFLSGSVMVGLLWFAWFQYPGIEQRAELLGGTVIGVVVGMGSRVLQLVLPSHPRPLHDPTLAFRVPTGVDPQQLNGWNSFPSDHAAVYFALAYVLYQRNARLGWIAAGAALLFDFARVYLGYHYASDIVGGAALGVCGTALLVRPATFKAARWLLRYESTQPGLFYMAAFVASFGLGTLFFDLRVMAAGIARDLGL